MAHVSNTKHQEEALPDRVIVLESHPQISAVVTAERSIFFMRPLVKPPIQTAGPIRTTRGSDLHERLGDEVLSGHRARIFTFLVFKAAHIVADHRIGK